MFVTCVAMLGCWQYVAAHERVAVRPAQLRHLSRTAESLMPADLLTLSLAVPWLLPEHRAAWLGNHCIHLCVNPPTQAAWQGAHHCVRSAQQCSVPASC
ncbi:hypothetical protein JKP88DRAFT_218655, partial [Tribonema minus]